ncbi:MAG: KTSC domain-containing protein [Alphaproteobacteria bacterium]|nr:MAG: KTSC domain-containing protein [Alphaproteobacteria bacterium]
MPSAAISRIVYEPEMQTLNIWFRETGELYRYYDVPPRVYDAFRKAMSKGRFFNRHIKDRYPFQHMSGDPDNGRHAA